MKPTKNLPAIIITLFGFLVFSASAETPKNQPALKVTAFKVDALDRNGEVSINAVVVPSELTPLSFRIPGKISNIFVREGDEVTRGQILAKLDDKQLQQQLKDQKARFELLKKQFERGKSLYTQDLLSKSEYDELNANFRLAEAHYKSAQLQLTYSEIKAPFSGLIATVDKKAFESTEPGSPMISIYRTDQIEILVELAGNVVTQVNQNIKKQLVKPDIRFASRAQVYQANYLEHTLEPDPETKTFKVWFTLPQLEQPIHPGHPVTLSVDSFEIGLKELKGPVLPLAALVAGENPAAFSAWKIENGLAQKVDITPGEVYWDGIEILKGVKQGDLIITSRQNKLRPGMAVITE